MSAQPIHPGAVEIRENSKIKLFMIGLGLLIGGAFLYHGLCNPTITPQQSKSSLWVGGVIFALVAFRLARLLRSFNARVLSVAPAGLIFADGTLLEWAHIKEHEWVRTRGMGFIPMGQTIVIKTRQSFLRKKIAFPMIRAEEYIRLCQVNGGEVNLVNLNILAW